MTSQRAEWCAPGISPQIANPLLQNFPVETIPRSILDRLEAGEAFSGIVREMPESGRALLEPQGILSVLLIPLTVEGALAGFIGFDDCWQERAWTDEEVDLLSSAAAAISLAMERHKAEALLRASECRYRELVAGLRDVVFETDAAGSWTFLNPAWEAITRFTVPESLGRPLLEFIHPDDQARSQELFRRLFERRQDHCRHEVRLRHKSGGFRWLEVHARVVTGVGGEALGTVGTLRDISKLKVAGDAVLRLNAELEQRVAQRTAELAEANARLTREVEERQRAQEVLTALERAVETLPIGITIADLAGRIVYTNPAEAALHGYEVAELLGQNARLLSPPELWHELSAEDIEKLQHWVRESRNVRKDGTVFPVQLASSVVRGPDGRPQGLVTSCEDISERRRAEDEIKLLAQAIRSINEGVSITDEENRILFVNDAFLRMYGYQREELVGRPIEMVRSPATAPRVGCEILPATLAGGWSGELVNRRKDGRDFRIALSTSVVHDENGKPLGLIGIINDVSERRQLEEQLRQAQKMDAIGKLAGGVAHDFNNILQALLTGIQSLPAHRADPAWLDRAVPELEAHVRRGAALTRQLLLFSRRETSQLELVDLGAVIRDAAAMLRRLVRENVHFELELGETPLPVEADRCQLEQVLMNLVVNACDAMPGGGRLVIRSGARDADTVVVEVEDNGVGMSPEVQAHLFEPFFTTKGPGKGTGIGLSVVHGIISGHGGKVAVRSTPGRGSTFTIVLPRASESAGRRADEETRGVLEAPPGRGERVLVVEDETGARDGLRVALEMLGYEVVAVASGEDAGRLPSQPAFDLLLTDLVLPGIDGAALARGLVDRWPGLKVVLMSGYTEDEAVRKEVSEGQVNFLQKPFDIHQLARELRTALND